MRLNETCNKVSIVKICLMYYLFRTFWKKNEMLCLYSFSTLL